MCGRKCMFGGIEIKQYCQIISVKNEGYEVFRKENLLNFYKVLRLDLEMNL